MSTAKKIKMVNNTCVLCNTGAIAVLDVLAVVKIWVFVAKIHNWKMYCQCLYSTFYLFTII